MELRKCTLGDLSLNGRGEYGIAASAVEYNPEKKVYLRITDICDDGTLDNSDRKSVEGVNLDRYILKPNDIVFARTGASTGRNYFYDGTDGEMVFAGFLIKFSIDERAVNPKFIKYYCLSKKYKAWIQSFATGSTRGNINAQTLASMPIDLPPLKLQDMIIGKLKELHIPERVIKQVSQDIAPLNVSLSSIGQTVDNNDLLNSLQKWFDNIANIRADQPAISAKEQLQNIVASFIGRQIGGEVAGRTNNLTFINTPLGNTFFPSEIKLPLAEQVVLTITSQTSTLRQELAFLDNVIALLHQDHNSALKPEMVATYPQLKNLAVLNEVDPPLLAEIVKKLPFTSEHLLENIYDLYQAIKETDVSKWLSAKTLRLDHHGAEAKTLITEELNSFISSALKETPSWRVVEMPLFDGNSFKPLKIALKKEQNEPQKQSQGLQDITRFIVETEFSKLGGFQFDGLTDKPKRHFDLIIRTSQNMKKDFCTDIINLFKKSIYNLGYAGSIKINQKEAFISFLPENTIKQGIYV